MSKNSSLGSSPIGGSSKQSSSPKSRSSRKSEEKKVAGSSLGSSPVEVEPNKRPKYDFIPDLGVSKSQQSSSSQSGSKGSSKSKQDQLTDSKSKKRIVSYNLEVDLISRVKRAAKEEEMYYSSVVSQALKNWLLEQG